MNLAEFWGDAGNKTTWGSRTVIDSSPNPMWLLQWALYPDSIYITLQAFPCWQILAVSTEATSVKVLLRRTPSLLRREHLTQTCAVRYDDVISLWINRVLGEVTLRHHIHCFYLGYVYLYSHLWLRDKSVSLCTKRHHWNYWINPGVTYAHSYRCSTL